MFKLLNRIMVIFSSQCGAIGLSDDQVSLYRKDMYKAEREGMKEIPPRYPDVYKVVNNVKGAGDKATQILKAGPLTRHTKEGQDIEFVSPIEGWTTLVKYHTYSDGLTFSPEAIEDTVKLGNLLKDLARTWGEEVRVAKEELGARVFNNGGALSGDFVFNGTHTGNTDSSGDLLYDSIPMFNLTGNPRTTKGGRATYYNSDSSLTVTPNDFETLYNLITSTNNTDEQDRIKANPVDAAMTRPGSNAFKMKRIIETPANQGFPGGNLNDNNVYFGLVTKHIIWDYLTSTEAAFYIGKAQHQAVQFHERLAPIIRFFRNENNAGFKASIRVRFGIHIKAGGWRAWARGGGTYA